ncbi:hypothetical protein QL285_057583 [Trifolium repens]|nr:hypothetical protein QL285_057583 [Trifolium repens]
MIPSSPLSMFNNSPTRPPPKPPPASLPFCENLFDVLALKSTSKNPSPPLDNCVVILGQSPPSKSTIHVMYENPIIHRHVVLALVKQRLFTRVLSINARDVCSIASISSSYPLRQHLICNLFDGILNMGLTVMD